METKKTTEKGDIEQAAPRDKQGWGPWTFDMDGQRIGT